MTTSSLNNNFFLFFSFFGFCEFSLLHSVFLLLLCMSGVGDVVVFICFFALAYFLKLCPSMLWCCSDPPSGGYVIRSILIDFRSNGSRFIESGVYPLYYNGEIIEFIWSEWTERDYGFSTYVRVFFFSFCLSFITWLKEKRKGGKGQ